MSSDSSSEDDNDVKSSSVSSGDATPKDAMPNPRATVDCRLPGLILVPSPVQLRNQQKTPPVAPVSNNDTRSHCRFCYDQPQWRGKKAPPPPSLDQRV
jgi:hypothetical protein